MTNDILELSINELDTVCGGAGSLGDVATYVKAYVEALGTVKASPYEGMQPCNNPAMYGPISN
jgi:hypothetical protein